MIKNHNPKQLIDVRVYLSMLFQEDKSIMVEETRQEATGAES